ncbi:MAG TPA: ATP-dependent DNA helicase RecG [Planctomycetaceae bacterium]|nr:ATP-dependent DNA helicase RecG [Planctomycetaceae bacterium]
MGKSEKPAAASLTTPVQFLPGVGPSRAPLLERLGLRTATDVLFCFPRDYQDLTQLRAIDGLEEDKLQTVVGTVEEFELRGSTPGRCVLGVLIRGQCGGYMRGLWFNQPFMQKQFYRGRRVMLSGKPRRNGLFWEMNHPTVTQLGDDEEEPGGRILPVYPLTEGLKQWQMRRIVESVLERHVELLDEVFPPEYLETHRLWPLRKALPEIHFPSDWQSMETARRRFVYQELFILQLGLAVRRRRQQLHGQAPPMEVSAKIDARIQRRFPFELTAAQKTAIAEISADMARTVPMNRLLQGDVGSGKTIVAVYAMLAAVAHGYQAVLMAPTEVLARQHVRTLERLLAGSQVRIGTLIGGLNTSARRDVLERIAEGQVDLIVGTQAILQESVRFAKLGLVVIDEQHKFGVRQRAALKQAGADPHYLVMTATPIPRTVTMTLFGDLDVSTLRDSPPGRKAVHTYLAEEGQRDRWWDFVRRKLGEGRQCYVVVPLVEETEAVAAVSLDAAYEALVNGPLEAFRVGLIHGRMTSDEKEAVMADFRCGEIQVLVCTSVVEVGVDVPNATLMTIESAERFGLAQLHQLRGRISRGRFPGYCAVFVGTDTEDVLARLKSFTSTTDGFELAEADFSQRGPGELFGTRQHGLPPFRVADLLQDKSFLEEARRDAMALVEADPGLSLPEHAKLRRQMLARYGKVLELGDVG